MGDWVMEDHLDPDIHLWPLLEAEHCPNCEALQAKLDAAPHHHNCSALLRRSECDCWKGKLNGKE